MQYKDKETGEIKTEKKIKQEYNELLGDSYEFEEYRDDFYKFLENYYTAIEE